MNPSNDNSSTENSDEISPRKNPPIASSADSQLAGEPSGSGQAAEGEVAAEEAAFEPVPGTSASPNADNEESGEPPAKMIRLEAVIPEPSQAGPSGLGRAQASFPQATGGYVTGAQVAIALRELGYGGEATADSNRRGIYTCTAPYQGPGCGYVEADDDNGEEEDGGEQEDEHEDGYVPSDGSDDTSDNGNPNGRGDANGHGDAGGDVGGDDDADGDDHNDAGGNDDADGNGVVLEPIAEVDEINNGDIDMIAPDQVNPADYQNGEEDEDNDAQDNQNQQGDGN